MSGSCGVSQNEFKLRGHREPSIATATLTFERNFPVKDKPPKAALRVLDRKISFENTVAVAIDGLD
jgi:hypothetical protein